MLGSHFKDGKSQHRAKLKTINIWLRIILYFLNMRNDNLVVNLFFETDKSEFQSILKNE